MVTRTAATALIRGLLVVAVLIAPGTARSESPEEHFERGNEAYADGRYAEAAAAYHEVLRYRIHDPRVEYNLANALVRVGRLGEAILHYERAYRMDPTDAEIRENLSFARSMSFDRVEPPGLPGPIRWGRGIQDRLGPDRQAWAFVAVVWILGALLALRLSRPGRWNATAGWAAAVLFLVAALVASSWWSTYQRLEGRRLAVVLQPAVEVLAGPGTNNPTLFTVHEGLTLDVRAERDEWIQVSLPNGMNGWIPARAAGFV